MVVNDCSERGVKLISEFVDSIHNEDDRQDLLLAIQMRRELLRGIRSKNDLQNAYDRA